VAAVLAQPTKTVIARELVAQHAMGSTASTVLLPRQVGGRAAAVVVAVVHALAAACRNPPQPVQLVALQARCKRARRRKTAHRAGSR
jgi:hypothetical protein